MVTDQVVRFRAWIFELKQNCYTPSDLPDEYSILNGNSQIGWIAPFSAKDFADAEKIQLLVEWRNKFHENFVSNKKVNYESTKNWLEKEVIGNINRELFWILNINKEYMGHVGIVYDEGSKQFEVDSILRGVESTTGIMWLGIKFIEDYIHEKFHVNQIFLRVLESNEKAISFYIRNGYNFFSVNDKQEITSDTKKVVFMAKVIKL